MPSARLLLVEDEPGLQLALSDRLVSEGYRVETAGDGEVAIARGLHQVALGRQPVAQCQLQAGFVFNEQQSLARHESGP